MKVGDRAIIGANAVVSKDVPADTVVAGIPARVISNNSSQSVDESWTAWLGR